MNMISTTIPTTPPSPIDTIQGVLGDAWRRKETIELPRPSSTLPFDGWTIGAIVRESKLVKIYIQHPQFGAWLHELPELEQCTKHDRFGLGMAAIQVIQTELPSLVEEEDLISKYLEMPLADRPRFTQERPLEIIRTDGDTQRRIGITPSVVDRYTLDMMHGAKFPALKVVFDGEHYWLYDGFHTRMAYINNEIDVVTVEVVYGTLKEARRLSLGVNGRHGHQVSDADKFAKVKWAVQQDEYKEMPHEQLALICNVTAPFITAVKSRLGIQDNGIRKVMRGGKEITVDTTNIGVRRSLEEVQILYEPWGDLTNSVHLDKPFELRQRGNLICSFRSCNEAYKLHPKVTAKIQKLVELPPGNLSCLNCRKRSGGGATWKCEAKNVEFGREIDWAKTNNGDCRLFDLKDFPRIDFNPTDFLDDDELVEDETADQEEEFFNTTDYLEEDEESAKPAKMGNEKYTPPLWVEFVTEVFGRKIELDPSSCEEANQIVKAKRFYTIEQDALAQSWEAETLFLNPPYSMPEIEKFAIKLLAEINDIGEFVMLVNACTETSWFQAVANQCDRLLFPANRINFWSPGSDPHSIKGSNEYRQCLLYKGPNIERFTQLGQKLGLVAAIV
jgi:hypothetical protein